MGIFAELPEICFQWNNSFNIVSPVTKASTKSRNIAYVDIVVKEMFVMNFLLTFGFSLHVYHPGICMNRAALFVKDISSHASNTILTAAMIMIRPRRCFLPLIFFLLLLLLLLGLISQVFKGSSLERASSTSGR